jgi:glycosyltransferase involved in cell wall biosynthesis
MTAAIKVLEVLGRSTGGIAGHVADITEGLNGRDGLTIDIASPPDLPVRMPKAFIPVDIPEGVRGHIAAMRKLHRIVSDGGYDVVHSHGLRAALDSGRACKRTPAVPMATIHNLVLPEISGRLQALAFRQGEPLAVRWNDHVFAPSRDIALRLSSAAPDHAFKLEVLHLGVARTSRAPRERDEVRAELGVGPGHQLLVTVARLAPQKALHVLLAAVAMLPQTAHLVIIGSGPLEAELKAMARRLALDERVRFLGYRPSPQDEVAAADVFCLSSVWEACSLAAQEAIGLGVPVVSSDVGGMPELIEDRVSGRLVRQGDVQALGDAIRELLAAPEEERRRLAGNATAHLELHFSRAQMLDRLESAYRGEGIAPS